MSILEIPNPRESCASAEEYREYYHGLYENGRALEVRYTTGTWAKCHSDPRMWELDREFRIREPEKIDPQFETFYSGKAQQLINQGLMVEWQLSIADDTWAYQKNPSCAEGYVYRLAEIPMAGTEQYVEYWQNMYTAGIPCEVPVKKKWKPLQRTPQYPGDWNTLFRVQPQTSGENMKSETNDRTDFSTNSFYKRGDKLEFIKEIESSGSWPLVGLYDTYAPKAMDPDTKNIYEREGMVFHLQVKKSVVKVKSEYLNQSYTFTPDRDGMTKFLGELNADIAKIGDQIVQRDKIRKVGRDMQPDTREVLEEVEVEIHIDGDASMHDRYIGIVGDLSQLTTAINKSAALGDSEELAKAFIEAKTKIEELTAQPPGRFVGFLDKHLANSKVYQKIKSSTAETLAANSSVQSNIDYLFGLIHRKYEQLVDTGKALQGAKGQVNAQLTLLKDLAVESLTNLESYGSPAEQPMNEVSLDTQIRAGVEKYNQRLLKIDGAILAMRSTIITLGKELPALKTDLTDEMAIGGLLGSVDDLQKMCSEVATLVAGVTESTAEQTHKVIENLFDMQINNTHTIKYLQSSTKRGKDFATMVTDKSQQLSDKVASDAKVISDIADGTYIANTRSQFKRIGGGESCGAR